MGVTGLIIGATAAAIASGGAAAYSASQQRKAAEAQAEAQREATEVARTEAREQLAYQKEAAAPGLRLEAAQVKAWEDIFGPMTRKLAPTIEQRFMDPEAMRKPVERQLEADVLQQMKEPFRLPEDVWQQVWQRGRERIAGEYQPLMQRTTERIAGMGPGKLESPVAQKLFADIEREKVRTIEDLAIDQAIAEWTEMVTAKQTATTQAMQFMQAQPDVEAKGLESAFRFMGFQPSVPGTPAPVVSMPAPYVAPTMPTGTTGIGEGIETGARIASLFAGTGGPTAEVKGGVGGTTQYVPGVGQTWSPPLIKQLGFSQ